MKKLLYVSASVVALSILCARADDAAPAAGAAPAPAPAKVAAPASTKAEMKEMTLTGTISKQDAKQDAKAKDKKPAAPVYSLACDDGTTVKLPTAKTTLKIEDFVGVKVKLTGVGTEKTGHDGKKVTYIQKITNIEKVTDQAPAK